MWAYISPMIGYLIPLLISAVWLTYRTFVVGMDSVRYSRNYNPRIHKREYVQKCQEKFQYFSFLCMGAVLMWIAFITILFVSVFGIAHGTSGI